MTAHSIPRCYSQTNRCWLSSGLPGAVEAHGDQISFARCNVDNNPKSFEKLEIRGIPTLMFFKGGQLADKLIGMVSKSIIEDAIRKCLSGSELTKLLIGQ